MRMRLLLLIVALSSVAPGCAKKPTSKATPKEAINNFIEGMLEFDKEKYMGAMTGDKRQLKTAAVFMDYMIALRDFRNAVIAKFGESGWTHFETAGGAKLSLDMMDNRDKLDSMKIEIDGDKAVCSMPGEAKVVNLIRKGGGWYVNAADVVTVGGTDLSEFAGMWTRMTELIRSTQKQINQPGVTAEFLDKELGKKMLVVMMTNR